MLSKKTLHHSKKRQQKRGHSNYVLPCSDQTGRATWKFLHVQKHVWFAEAATKTPCVGLYKTKLINTKWPTSSYMYSMKGMLIAGHVVQELHLHVTSAILYEAKQTGVDLFCFIANSLTFRCGFCHRHVVFAQAEQQNTKKQGHICCPPENDNQRNLHNGKALDLPIFFAKMFCFLYIFVKRLGHASSLWKSLRYNIQKSLLQILQQSQVSTHTTHLVAAALHGMHLHVQSNKHHNTKRNPTTLWSRRWNSFGAPARTGQPATCK